MIPIMSKTIFKIRGRTDTGLLRDNNEDNFTICADLSKTEEAWFIPEEKSLILGDLGCVMAVADGMGGTNAGEVASDIAIKAIEEQFSDREQLTKIKDLREIEKFMVEALIYADAKINERIKKDRSTEGMGTTVVLLWALNGRAYYCWCGDSRAYLFNKKNEPHLKRLSKDHSYVQQLVDEGKLTEDEAFDHPESNIITKCLGGGVDVPSPDFACHPLQKGDIYLLCTDGLCGVCKDNAISTVLDTYEGDAPRLCLDLIDLAKKEGGPDNITVTMLEILDANEPSSESPYSQTVPPDTGRLDKNAKRKTIKMIVGGFVSVALIVTAYSLWKVKEDPATSVTDPVSVSSTELGNTSQDTNNGTDIDHKNDTDDKERFKVFDIFNGVWEPIDNSSSGFGLGSSYHDKEFAANAKAGESNNSK
jgi:protein phosphatase